MLSLQMARTTNPDNARKLAFIAPSLSADAEVRDEFFASLADPANRETENWVLIAIANLHHPLRIADAERYIEPSLALLEEIQVTGDIFFPKRWLVNIPMPSGNCDGNIFFRQVVWHKTPGRVLCIVITFIRA